MAGDADVVCFASVLHVLVFGAIVRGQRGLRSPWYAVACALLPPFALVAQCWFDEGARCSVHEHAGGDDSYTVSNVVQRLPAYFFFAAASTAWALAAGALWWQRGARVAAACATLAALALVALPLRSGLETGHHAALFALFGVVAACVLLSSRLRTRTALAHLAASWAAGGVATYIVWSGEESEMWRYFGFAAEVVALLHASALFL